VSPSAVPLCPSCHSPTAAWQIDSPVRAHDRALIDPSGMTLLGLRTPDDGLEPVDHPEIQCAACGAEAVEPALRDAVLAAATAASRGEPARFDA
jgi:hypothetical protein